ncbi:MAG: hypothetical protein PHP93_09340, partial [Kiritimatiellales bacterium]|nr:hypothetical protein [Kiritimatiellales bacterium]
METSGHGALKENYFLDDGAYQIAKILIKAAQLHAAGHGGVDVLVAGLPEPAETKEYRAKIETADFGPYGDALLKKFEQFVADEPGWSATPNNFEGVHVTVDATHGNGWALLRKSLHDPVMPLNIESEEAGGVAQIAARMKAFLSQFDQLDLPAM